MNLTVTSYRVPAMLLAFVLAFSVAGTANSQTLIEPGPPGTINDAINGDTTATGERNTCHYVLQRDQVYIYTERMRLEGNCNWTIEAEAGTGARPIIKPAAVPGGDEAPRPFQAYQEGSTVTLRDLYLDGYDTSLPDPGRPGDNAMVRASADNIRFIIENVRFDRNRQSAMRTDNANTKWYVTDSEFSNLYNTNRPAQSFVLDTRGNVVDSVVFINNSIWNHTADITRNADDARIHYYKMDHNTFVNIGAIPGDVASGRLDTLRAELPGEQNYAVINMGQTEYAVFRNNLMVNPGFGGTETKDVFIPRFIVNVDSMIVDVDDTTFEVVPPKGVDIRNNVISLDPVLAEAYPDTVRLYDEEQYYDPTLDAFIEEGGRGESLLAIQVALADAPGPPGEFVSEMYRILVENPDPQPPLILPRDTRDLPNGEGTLDFSYPTDSPAYTAAMDDLPVGDLSWFGMEEGYTSAPDAFVTLTPVAAEDRNHLPNAFELRGNYPNPFNPTTTVEFDLHRSAHVSVALFNVLGQKVLELPARQLAAGSGQQIRVDAGSLPSGLYLYQVMAEIGTDKLTQSGRMVLIK